MRTGPGRSRGLPHAARPRPWLIRLLPTSLCPPMPVAPEPLIPAPYLRPHLPARGAQWHRPDGVKRGQGGSGTGSGRCDADAHRGLVPGVHALIIRSTGLATCLLPIGDRDLGHHSVDVARWQLVSAVLAAVVGQLGRFRLWRLREVSRRRRRPVGPTLRRSTTSWS
jgi:hypothetical protein